MVCLKKWLAVVPSVQEKNISSATCKFWEWVMREKDNCLNWHKIWSGKCCRRARNAKIPQSSCKQIYWIISFTAFCMCTQLLLHTSILLHTCFCYSRTGSSVELTEDDRGKNDALLLSRWLRKISNTLNTVEMTNLNVTSVIQEYISLSFFTYAKVKKCSKKNLIPFCKHWFDLMNAHLLWISCLKMCYSLLYFFKLIWPQNKMGIWNNMNCTLKDNLKSS